MAHVNLDLEGTVTHSDSPTRLHISYIRNISNFLFILQVNSHPLKSMDRRQVRFPKISIYFCGPCLQNQAYNFRVQYLLGCLWVGPHAVTPACLYIGLKLTLPSASVFPGLGLCYHACLCQLILNPALHFILRTELFRVVGSQQVYLGLDV